MTDTLTAEASHETLVKIELLARQAHAIADDALALEDRLGELIHTLAGFTGPPPGEFFEQLDRDANAKEQS